MDCVIAVELFRLGLFKPKQQTFDLKNSLMPPAPTIGPGKSLYFGAVGMLVAPIRLQQLHNHDCNVINTLLFVGLTLLKE